MAISSVRPSVLVLAGLGLLLLLCLGPGGVRGNKLKQMLQKREASSGARGGSGVGMLANKQAQGKPTPAKTNVAVAEHTAKEFLGGLKRAKRQLWDRTRPEVQQWYQQFLYMGFDEAKFEDDVNYWMNRNRNGHDYYGDYYQRHYDEDAAIGPHSPESFRHGASVNYDDY